MSVMNTHEDQSNTQAVANLVALSYSNLLTRFVKDLKKCIPKILIPENIMIDLYISTSKKKICKCSHEMITGFDYNKTGTVTHVLH